VNSPRFVIQIHFAKSLHYDFRLERDGVFKSRAVPKGVPEVPGVPRIGSQNEAIGRGRSKTDAHVLDG